MILPTNTLTLSTRTLDLLLTPCKSSQPRRAKWSVQLKIPSKSYPSLTKPSSKTPSLSPKSYILPNTLIITLFKDPKCKILLISTTSFSPVKPLTSSTIFTPISLLNDPKHDILFGLNKWVDEIRLRFLQYSPNGANPIARWKRSS
uniref:Uncharacterized protein n=1 Tax=Opuntia streptacantha TaxID=393608 RepID=A0A7C8ZIQ2_OPUST